MNLLSHLGLTPQALCCCLLRRLTPEYSGMGSEVKVSRSLRMLPNGGRFLIGFAFSFIYDLIIILDWDKKISSFLESRLTVKKAKKPRS